MQAFVCVHEEKPTFSSLLLETYLYPVKKYKNDGLPQEIHLLPTAQHAARKFLHNNSDSHVADLLASFVEFQIKSAGQLSDCVSAPGDTPTELYGPFQKSL